MIRLLFSMAFVAILAVFGLSIYLSPNDLADCGDKPTVNNDCQAVDAIVAVSGGDTAARTHEAVRLYNNGWAAKLILSGAAQDKSGPSNAKVMSDIAIAGGVPESAILVDEYAETTKQNAENVKSIFEQNSIKKVILVTSGYHQRRASLEFNKRTNVTIVNHPVASDGDWSFWWWLTPKGWWLALTEFMKIIFFYTIGAINYA